MTISAIVGSFSQDTMAFGLQGWPAATEAAEGDGIAMHVDRFDHIVLTVADIDRTCDFYRRACGMEIVTFGNGRKALQFGRQKINLHQAGKEIDPKAARPTAGSGDFCLITSVPIEAVKRHLEASGFVIEEGIVDRTGAVGPIRSIYLRDPDMNLVEISCSTSSGDSGSTSSDPAIIDEAHVTATTPSLDIAVLPGDGIGRAGASAHPP